MQSKQIKEWVKANKLLSAIIVGVIIVAIILYSGVNKQVPKTEGQLSKEDVAKIPSEGAVGAPTQEVTAPETTPEEAPPEPAVPETPGEETPGDITPPIQEETAAQT